MSIGVAFLVEGNVVPKIRVVSQRSGIDRMRFGTKLRQGAAPLETTRCHDIHGGLVGRDLLHHPFAVAPVRVENLRERSGQSCCSSPLRRWDVSTLCRTRPRLSKASKNSAHAERMQSACRAHALLAARRLGVRRPPRARSHNRHRTCAPRRSSRRTLGPATGRFDVLMKLLLRGRGREKSIFCGRGRE